MKADAIAMVFVEVRDSAQPKDTATMKEIEQDFAEKAADVLREAFKGLPNVRVSATSGQATW